MDPKPWYTSKTILFNILAIAVYVANLAGFADFKLDPTVLALVSAVANIVLRFLTTQPIGTPAL